MEYLYLGLVLFAPWLLILSWVYWSFPRTLPRTAGRRWFDVAILLLAVIVAVLSGYYGVTSTVYLSSHGMIGGWQMAAPPIYAYGGYSAALAIGVLLRRMIWRRPA